MIANLVAATAPQHHEADASPPCDARHHAANATDTEALAPIQPPSRESGAVSCIIPCHNEARNLEQLLPRLRDTLQACAHPWEVILVDDGSSDATSLVLAKWAQTPGFRFATPHSGDSQHLHETNF